MAADIGHALFGFGEYFLEFAVRRDTGVHEVLSVGDDGIDVHPVLNLTLLAVGVLVGHAVAAEAVGKRIEQHGAFALFEYFELSLHCVDDRQGVKAVDTLCVHLAGSEACAQTRQHVVGHGLAPGLAAHAVAVVEYVEEYRHASRGSAVVGPQGVELIHARKVQRLEHGAAAKRAVAYVAHNEAVLARALLVQRGAGSDRRGAADYGVVGIHAEGQEERVHRAAQTHMEAGLAGEYLGKCSVKYKADSELLDRINRAHLLYRPQRRAAQEAFHDLGQLLVGELLYGGKRLGEYLAMASVRTELVVVWRHQIRLTDAGGFLTDGQVSGAGIGGLDAVIYLLGLDRGEHGLELAQDGDIPVNADKLLVLEVFALLSDGFVVSVYLDVGKVNLALRADLFRPVIQ